MTRCSRALFEKPFLIWPIVGVLAAFGFLDVRDAFAQSGEPVRYAYELTDSAAGQLTTDGNLAANACVVVGDPLTPDERRYAARHLALGKPQAVYERFREGYVLAEDARLKIPLWVQYELKREELDGPGSRTEDFRPDTSIPAGARAELADYRSSGFDRGHMAPAADMKRSEKVMSESFLLSNMAPQVGIGMNRGLWADLEDAIRQWVFMRETLTIISGPVFDASGTFVTYRVIGPNRVAVPTHFFKIVIDDNNPAKPQILAFLIPNQDLTGRHFSEFLTTVDAIERVTSLDFLSALPDALEKLVEARKAPQVW